MVSYRQRRKRRGRLVTLLALTGCTLGVGWWLLRDSELTTSDTSLASTVKPSLTSDRPEIEPTAGPRPGTIERGSIPDENTKTQAQTPPGARSKQLLAAGRQALSRKDWIGARELFSEAFELGVEKRDQIQVRADLTRIGEETIFSSRTINDDPFVDRYIVSTGDTLGKIAHKYHVSSDFLASINGIENKNLIRVGQTLKVVHGPFHAVIDKGSYTLDVYLGQETSRTFVKRFKVGLGADGSTPTGTWRVKNKLKNPTYYPPRGGKILGADNPENPLGERWIGVEGVSGEAVGQQRYGIHGTTDPTSIGHNASMGCIRLYNEDVEALFDYLIVNHSTVTVK